jgi:hypothetical protein
MEGRLVGPPLGLLVGIKKGDLVGEQLGEQMIKMAASNTSEIRQIFMSENISLMGKLEARWC